jgi:Aldehyde ferredoxin oxidoreductase, N-terminal domain
MNLENAYMGRILVVDLNEGTCEEEELTEEMVREHTGGASINLALYQRHLDRSPVVFGTGLLTGTFAPSSCAGVVTGKSPVTGRVCHVPLLWQTAVELKYSGFDFMVILGESEKPVRLWLHDELAELVDAADVWGKNVWETMDKLRFEHGDDYVQVIGVGPAGEKGCRIAQVSESAWGSRDVFGLGLAMGGRKLKAIAMRGLGSLEVADGFFDECVQSRQEIGKGRIFAKQGLLALLEALGLDPAELEPIRQRVHRNAASFNCAYAANTFLMIDEAPDLLKESKKGEPGVLATDAAGMISLAFLKEGLPIVLREINRMGLEPVACGSLLRKEGVTEVDEAVKRVHAFAGQGADLGKAGVENVYGTAPWPLSESMEARLIQTVSVFSHAVPLRPLGGGWADFAVGEAPVERAQWWLDRMAACSILGICPISTLLSPAFSLKRMAHLAAKAVAWDALTEEELLKRSRKLVQETHALGEGAGTLPSAWASPDLDAGLKALRQVWGG